MFTSERKKKSRQEIKYFGIAPLPRFLLQLFLPGMPKKNVVSLWDPVSLKHIASFVKWQHGRKRPATRMSYTRTVNSCNPDTGRWVMLWGTLVSGFQREETLHFIAGEAPATTAWRKRAVPLETQRKQNSTRKSWLSFHKTSVCVEVNLSHGAHMQTHTWKVIAWNTPTFSWMIFRPSCQQASTLLCMSKTESLIPNELQGF